jgi:hypothetical protein
LLHYGIPDGGITILYYSANLHGSLGIGREGV